MKRQYLTKIKLPDKPGVYIFRDLKKRPLYIGRATSLKDRVKSYFALDLIETRGPRIIDMVTKAVSLTWQETDSVLEAIILESNLIKKYQPQYNVDERDDKSDLYVVITDELWPRVFTVRARDYDKKSHKEIPIKFIFGPYVHSGLLNESLKIIRKIFPFKDKRSLDSRHESFYKAIGRSPQDDNVNARRRYQRTINNLALFFQGKKDILVKSLEKEMNLYAQKLEFEEAQLVKRTLYALRHINDIALIKHEKLSQSSNFRMEAYDIAHLSGTNTVGAMAVSVDGELVPDEYRLFKISRDANNDVASLVEILSRRFNHPEWTYPDLIVVDGNEVQLKAAEAVLAARRINIKVVAVTKNEKHKADKIIGHEDIAQKNSDKIIALNAEVHRFALKYHRKRRSKMI